MIAEIYLGRIKRWNDPLIKPLNPEITCPTTITPIFRFDGSGDTYAFTDYLTRISGDWRSQVGPGTSVQFPTGVGGRGNAGVTAVLQSTDGGIAYVAVSYLIAHHLPAAAIKNAAGKFEFPNLQNIENAAQSVTVVPSEQRAAHRQSTEEREDRLPDLDVHLRDRAQVKPELDRCSGSGCCTSSVRDRRSARRSTSRRSRRSCTTRARTTAFSIQ